MYVTGLSVVGAVGSNVTFLACLKSMLSVSNRSKYSSWSPLTSCTLFVQTSLNLYYLTQCQCLVGLAKGLTLTLVPLFTQPPEKKQQTYLTQTSTIYIFQIYTALEQSLQTRFYALEIIITIIKYSNHSY